MQKLRILKRHLPMPVIKIPLAMKLTFLLMTVVFLQVHAVTDAQTITLKGKDIPFSQVITTIKKQTGFLVLSTRKLLSDISPVSVSVQNMPLTDFMDLVLKNQPFSYQVMQKTILISSMQATENVTKTPSVVTGRIIDSVGNPIVGASIRLSPGKKGTASQEDGSFKIENVAPGNYILEITLLGFNTVQQRITVSSEGSILSLGNITLKTMLYSLDGVSVTYSTGYQKLPKERATGAFGTVTEKMLGARMETNLVDRLEGTVAGMYVNKGNVTIRGLSTLYGNQSPLFVVDGFPYEGDLGFINPADVVNVTVMKDAAAASIYGTRAANGVISITTRHGNAHKTTVNVGSTVFMTPIPDASYFNYMSSAQMVDFQQELFNIYHPGYNANTMRYAQPKVLEALYKHEQNLIDQQELDNTLNTLRNSNGIGQVQDLLMQDAVKQRYNFSVNGGNDLHIFNLSMNYTANQGDNLRSRTGEMNINIKDRMKVFKWLTAEAGIATNLSNYRSPSRGGTGLYNSMPYEVIKDADGNLVPWNWLKSQTEIDRLKNEGLLDESFNPLNELYKTDNLGHSNYFRLQGGFTAKIIEGLSLDLKYQTERGSNYFKNFYSADSYESKHMINEATQIVNGEIIKNVPDGGQISERRGDSKSYTARLQLNYDKNIADKHFITALAGAERRAIVTSATRVFKMGYNDNNLQFMPVDEVALGSLKGTESINSTFNFDYNSYNNFTYFEDRYVSAYGNVGYNYDHKYNATASVRVDNSNLFGTDPRYRYLPLWSFGLGWRMTEETFLKDANWLNNLNIRATYGLGGNVAKQVGPYLQASSSFFSETGANATNIVYPPNKSLRWEKTATTNFGIDFAVLSNRISGSVDYYIRKSTDLLGQKATDPTNAFSTALINFGSMNNKGFELSLKTVNVQGKNFSWYSALNMSINKNKMTEINTNDESVIGLTSGFGVNRVGYPMDAVFNFRFAGLDPGNGSVLVYDADGKVVKNYDDNGTIVANMTDINGLVYSGTMRPTYTVGFTNTFSYKQFDLHIMMIGNGGNVMRDVTKAINTLNFSNNQDKRTLNFWKQPGDEKIPGMLPAPDLKGNGGLYYSIIWFAEDVNTMKADYIKVRDIALSYHFPERLFKTKKITAAKFTLQVQNPFHWYRNDAGIDPEAYASYSIYADRTMPVMRTYMAGLDLTF
ncbi:SusC/RagA family TonB-linked outer membrane protein [Chitinophaga caeni]|uniref:SusC/RagA family TonB-linked outer membrane protein n=2 Tax=Chitinophaga caeni TaxID=2029983 RepID=A0A291QQK2_9BACT|nr:SusC/RagA family TonB-linked outer membrane protein [Chitinophaga caeni]